MLPLAKQSLDEAPYKLSRAVAKLAGIPFWSIGFFLDTIKPWFLTEGKFATVLIIPSSWGSQLGGYLPASSIHRCCQILSCYWGSLYPFGEFIDCDQHVDVSTWP
jgi:hypothetical protein